MGPEKKVGVSNLLEPFPITLYSIKYWNPFYRLSKHTNLLVIFQPERTVLLGLILGGLGGWGAVVE